MVYRGSWIKIYPFSGISTKKVDADGDLKDPGYLLLKKLIANIRKC